MISSLWLLENVLVKSWGLVIEKCSFYRFILGYELSCEILRMFKKWWLRCIVSHSIRLLKCGLDSIITRYLSIKLWTQIRLDSRLEVGIPYEVFMQVSSWNMHAGHQTMEYVCSHRALYLGEFSLLSIKLSLLDRPISKLSRLTRP